MNPILEINASIAHARGLVVRPGVVRRTLAEVPEALRSATVCTTWYDETIETWLAAQELPKEQVVFIPRDRWAKVFEDMVRATGPTNWNDPFKREDHAVFFAGRWVAPDLSPPPVEYTAFEIPAPPGGVLQPALYPDPLSFEGVEIVWDPPYIPPKRCGRLRLISGLEMLVLRIPRASMRGKYMANQDAGYVDFRRLKRDRRAHDRRAPRPLGEYLC